MQPHEKILGALVRQASGRRPRECCGSWRKPTIAAWTGEVSEEFVIYQTDDFRDLTETQRQYFYTNETKSYEFRVVQLGLLERAIKKYECRLYTAFETDLKKSEFETYTTEIGFVLGNIGEIKRNLKKWMAPKKVRNPLFLAASRSRIYNEPRGVTLIIGAHNYPFQLTIGPLAEAMAAGNTAVLKPSELTPNVSGLIRDMICEVFPREYVYVAEGGSETASSLLRQRFDLIFFTGSKRAGRLVLEAAAANLTPVVLELGGKSPAIVAADADIKEAARKISWGKFLNAGQTCVAPDYVLADEKIKPSLVSEIKNAIGEFYGADPLKSKDYGRIVNERHWDRLYGYLLNNLGQIIAGGRSDRLERYIAPTLLDPVTWKDEIMKEEIFGPILPILTFNGRNFDEEVTAVIRNREKPLALYLFTGDSRLKKRVIENLSFGGGTINDTVLHLGNFNLPFGGTGHSGMGHYHGEYGFNTFSHQKSVFEKSRLIRLDVLYPPYSPGKLALIKKIFK